MRLANIGVAPILGFGDVTRNQMILCQGLPRNNIVVFQGANKGISQHAFRISHATLRNK
jgi:hypothetical protein